MKKYDKMILIILLVVFGAGIFMTARSAMSTYVTFADAKETDRSVQVKGLAVNGTIQDISDDKYSFQMEDTTGGVVRVIATGTMPVNLFEAESVVVTGKYNGEVFEANKILVKCPSKYEAQEHPDDVEKE